MRGIVGAVAAGVAAFAIVFAFAACGSAATSNDEDGKPANPNEVGVVTIQVNGRSVDCVTYRGYGIDCNW